MKVSHLVERYEDQPLKGGRIRTGVYTLYDTNKNNFIAEISTSPGANAGYILRPIEWKLNGLRPPGSNFILFDSADRARDYIEYHRRDIETNWPDKADEILPIFEYIQIYALIGIPKGAEGG